MLLLSHYYGQLLAKRGYGGIILFGSLVAYQGVPNSAHYSATKAYIQSLAEALNIELKEYGVDVLSAAPGPVSSGFSSRAHMKMGAADRPETVARGVVKSLGKNMTVVPGKVGKVLTYSLKLAPRFFRVRIMGHIMNNMTKHKNI